MLTQTDPQRIRLQRCRAAPHCQWKRCEVQTAHWWLEQGKAQQSPRNKHHGVSPTGCHAPHCAGSLWSHLLDTAEGHELCQMGSKTARRGQVGDFRTKAERYSVPEGSLAVVKAMFCDWQCVEPTRKSPSPLLFPQLVFLVEATGLQHSAQRPADWRSSFEQQRSLAVVVLVQHLWGKTFAPGWEQSTGLWLQLLCHTPVEPVAKRLVDQILLVE